jgi:hypothetical protein
MADQGNYQGMHNSTRKTSPDILQIYRTVRIMDSTARANAKKRAVKNTPPRVQKVPVAPSVTIPPFAGGHGGGKTQVSNSSNSSSSISSGGMTSISGTPLGIRDTSDKGRWATILATIAPVRGKAVSLLADKVLGNRWCPDYVTAVEMAIDLLTFESDETCEAVATLLGDTWSGGVGELLACAREL